MKRTLYTFLINWYQASDKPLPGWLKRACDSDETMAQERRFGDELTASLRQKPKEGNPFGESSLASKVHQRITEEDFEAEQSETSEGYGFVRFFQYAGLAAAACLVAAIAFKFTQSGPGENESLDKGGMVAGVDEIPMTLNPDLVELGEAWINPLDQEIEYVLSDAKGALDFLKSSFVPSSYLKDGPRETVSQG